MTRRRTWDSVIGTWVFPLSDLARAPSSPMGALTAPCSESVSQEHCTKLLGVLSVAPRAVSLGKVTEMLCCRLTGCVHEPQAQAGDVLPKSRLGAVSWRDVPQVLCFSLHLHPASLTVPPSKHCYWPLCWGISFSQ